MGRRVEYYCDACGKSFGNETHLNIKQGRLYLSWFDDVTGLESDIWRQKEVKFGCNELHFCNANCMMVYIGNKVKDVEYSLEESKKGVKDA